MNVSLGSDILILDAWLRSKLPAGDFAPLVGLSLHTLRTWKARFAEHGPADLDDKPLGRPSGSPLPEATKWAVLLLKEQRRTRIPPKAASAGVGPAR